MKKLLVTALLCTFGILTLAACPGHEEFQAATGTPVDTPNAKEYNPNIDVVNGTNLDYKADLYEEPEELNDVSDMDLDKMQDDIDMY